MREITNKDEYEELCDEIWHHNRCYFQDAVPEISDEEFDDLLCSLEKIEQTHPEWVSETSPTQRVGEKPLEGFQESIHEFPMLSLEKAFKKEELSSFYERLTRLVEREKIDFFAELKMDGLAISALYEEGKLVRAVTRGDGRKGSDITQNFKTILHVPLRISTQIKRLEVRGEVFLPKKAFAYMNEKREKEGLAPWANPRNAAAGSLKLLDSRELAKREGLSCLFYGISVVEPHQITYQHEVFDFLHSLGLPTYLSVQDLSLKPWGVVSSVEEMLSFQRTIHDVRSTLPFEIDGVVFKLDSLDESFAIAPTLKHPRTSIAWKFGAEQVWTILKEIVAQVGRTGVITPIAELEPVEVSGSTVRRATLHNIEEIERKDVRSGDRVLIEKGGDVIPKVVRSDKGGQRQASWKMPTACPSCDTLLVKDEEGVAWRCLNHRSCPEQIIRGLMHFVGKEGLDIEHVGEKLIRTLFSAGYVHSFHELFLLTKEQLVQLEGIKEKSAENIISGIAGAKNPPFDKYLMALGIRFIGAGTARRIAQEAISFDRLAAFSKEQLLHIEGVGEEVAHSLYAHLHDELFMQQAHQLKEIGVKPKIIEQTLGIEGHPFNGKTVVLTGTFTMMKRAEAVQAILFCGGKVGDSVSKKTGYVIVGEKPGSKFEKAKKLHIAVLDEDEFMKIVKNKNEGFVYD